MTTFVAIFFILHGLVHGILALSPNPDAPEAVFANFFSRSRLFSSVDLPESAARLVAFLLAGLATIGFIAAGLALLDFLVPFDWWRTLSVASAVISLLLLALFWHHFLFIGIVIDVAILAAPIFFNWTPE